MVDKTLDSGYQLVGEGLDYEDAYRFAYIRGPEGLTVDVAEPLWTDSASA